jgi:hypothetical protein
MIKLEHDGCSATKRDTVAGTNTKQQQTRQQSISYWISYSLESAWLTSWLSTSSLAKAMAQVESSSTPMRRVLTRILRICHYARALGAFAIVNSSLAVLGVLKNLEKTGLSKCLVLFNFFSDLNPRGLFTAKTSGPSSLPEW